MAKLRIMTVFGTRPEAVKMAPVIKELERRSGEIVPLVAVTAQHREMLDQVLELFEITPNYDLNIMQANQTLHDITSRALLGLRDVISEAKPDMILVHGDTTTTFVAALAGFYAQVPVGHVEAGLRTQNKYSPFPEEMNRKLTGAIADLHFSPTETSKANLLAEGVKLENIFVTGNTVIDALLATVRDNYTFADPVLNQLDFANRKVILVTTHRRENLGEPMRNIYLALQQLIEENPDVEIIFPMHKNPHVREVVNSVLGQTERVHLIEPLDYQPFVNLMARSHIILTDSGGVQEEAPSFGKPVLVLRDTTERPEAVEAGTVLLIGTDRNEVYRTASTLLKDPAAYSKMANAINPYGDGLAAARIVDSILYSFKNSKNRPKDFKANISENLL
ncbi:MAG TPA: UDP-N-acetylglucosamine 2-epimerase (non-hydrolyzing) [Candidatus Deferrimicrobium sp.]|nr:UDP-N-acetylglucosamine 2-epimerase (non-hydrolyzing) [Candidatus Deferrimicrobium sp.]